MKHSLIFIGFSILISCFSCKNKEESNLTDEALETQQEKPVFSLAQWSFNRELFAGSMDNQGFIKRASEMGFEAVEYVSQFFQDKVEDFVFLDSLNAAARNAGIKNHLVMVDGAGLLGSQNDSIRRASVEAHKLWIDATSYLGCLYMRINAHGDGTPEEMMITCEKSVRELAAYTKSKNVTILIENHGGLSNDGAWLKNLISKLQDVNVGSLPDFDNWCIERENGQLWGAPCIKEYPRYQGMEDLLPFAKAISIKAFDFDENGDETTIDFKKMFQLIHDYKYNEFLAIEYEGDSLSSDEGIEMTRALARRYFIKPE